MIYGIGDGIKRDQNTLVCRYTKGSKVYNSRTWPEPDRQSQDLSFSHDARNIRSSMSAKVYSSPIALSFELLKH